MESLVDYINILNLSHELLCHIISFLPLRSMLSIAMLCKKLRDSVSMHLRLCKSLDFAEGVIFGHMPSSITDEHMHCLLKKCPHLEIVYGLHPQKMERRRLRKRSALTVPGIIEALCLCPHLRGVETCDLRLMEAILQHLPEIEIIGNFRNRDGAFPLQSAQRLKLQPYPRITSLHLTGVEVPELTIMPDLKHLYLQWVRFTRPHPFRAFMAPNLKTFVMRHCMGPPVALRYLSLIVALSTAPSLMRLELVRVPILGGLIQRAVEDSWKNGGFRKLHTLVITGCKNILESDIGHLMIVASKNLETVSLQPSLTKDSLFVSLSFAQCDFGCLKALHLGYMDDFPSKGEWSNDFLLTLGLADVSDIPSPITDSGMKVISQLFPNLKSMSICNCPHLMTPNLWVVEGQQAWKNLTDLTLQRCHCLRLPSFALFLALLPAIETVILEDMFREPPKGCSHVGLSAGTGLGMSSAVVSNQEEQVAVQGQAHEDAAELQDQNDNIENDHFDQELMDVQQQQPELADIQHQNLPRQGENEAQQIEVYREVLLQNDVEQNVQQPQNLEEEEENYHHMPREEADVGDMGQNVTSESDEYLDYYYEDDEEMLEDPLCLSYSHETEDHETSDKKEFLERNRKKQKRDYEDLTQPSTSYSNENKLSLDNIKGKHNTDYDQEQPGCSWMQDQNEHVPKDEDLLNNQNTLSKDNKNKLDSSPENKTNDAKGSRTLKRKSARMSLQNSQKKSNFVKASHSSQEKSTSNVNSQNASSTQNCDVLEPQPSTSSGVSHSSISETSNCVPPSQIADSSLPSEQDIHAVNTYEGPMTRQRKKMLSSQVVAKSNLVSQGTQATSEDIRRTLGRQRAVQVAVNRSNEIPSPPLPHENANANRESGSGRSRRDSKRKKCVGKPCDRRDPNVCDKTTSTSDPLLEDDPVQVFRVVSETLMTLSVISCGVSDIIIDHCHGLVHVEVQACRILKKIHLHHCPYVVRLGVSQCPKMDITSLVSEVLSLSTKRGRLVFIEPCGARYDSREIEKAAFKNSAADHDVFLLHDYSSDSTDRGIYREKVLSWLRLFSRMCRVYSIWAMKQLPSFHLRKCECSTDGYPWGHHLTKMNGQFPDGRYEIVTNNPFLKEVWWRHDGNPLNSDSCFPSPESCGYISLSQFVSIISEAIAEWKEMEHVIHTRHVGFYVHIIEES